MASMHRVSLPFMGPRWPARVRAALTPWNIVTSVAVVVVAYLVLVPLGYLIYESLGGSDGFSLDAFTRAYSAERDAGPMMVNTLIYSVGSTVLAFVIGATLAFLTVRTDLPFKGLMFAGSLAPIVIPDILFAPAWIFFAAPRTGLFNIAVSQPLLGRDIINVMSMPGMILVQGLHSVPIAYLFMVSAFRGMDPSLESSALLSGARRMTVLRRITLPLMRPATVAALLLLFIMAIESFEVPAILGIPGRVWVFTSRIFFETGKYPIDYGVTGAYALALMGIAVVAGLASRWATRNARGFQTISGKAFRPQLMELGRARPIVGLAVMGYFMIALVMPVVILLYVSLLPYYQAVSVEAFQSMSLANYGKVLAIPGVITALKNSLILGAATATTVMVLTSVVAWIIVRTEARGRRALDILTITPLTIPGLVMSLALLFAYLRIPLPIYGTMFLLLISLTTAYLPYGVRFAAAALSQVGNELEESALVSGASRLQTFRRIMMPLVSSGLIAGWMYVAIIALRSLSNIVLLYAPGTEVLPVVIFEMQVEGNSTSLAAVGVLMIGILVLLVAAAYRVGVRFGVTEGFG